MAQAKIYKTKHFRKFERLAKTDQAKPVVNESPLKQASLGKEANALSVDTTGPASAFVNDEDMIEFEEERRKIEEEFGETNFAICLQSSDLDEVLTHKKDVFISHSLKCYCYKRKGEIYHLHSEVPITKRVVIKRLIEVDFNTNCGHRYLEDIWMETPSQVGLYFGS